MADCIDALIDADLIATLQTINEANGYNTEIGTVERVRTSLDINNRFPYTLVIQMDPDQIDEFAQFQNDKLQYVIWHFKKVNDKNETENTELPYEYRNVHADIIKALKADVSRGGYAQNTTVPRHGIGALEGEEWLFGAYCFVEIERLIDPNDPYKLA